VRSAAPGQPEVTTRNFLREQGTLFDVTSAAVDFGHLKTNQANSRRYVRLNQMYAGIPMFGAQVMIQLNSVDDTEWRFLDVAYDGSRGSPNGSFLRPFTSFAEAISKTPAGGTIGLLATQTIPAVGTYDKPITIRAAPGVEAILGN
jgi:hypothetical protein